MQIRKLLSRVFSTDWDIVCNDNTDTITSLNRPNGMVTTDWSCELGSDGTCLSIASCDYFGNMTTCELTGGFDATGWSGTMSASIDASLPDSNGDGTNSPIVESHDCCW